MAASSPELLGVPRLRETQERFLSAIRSGSDDPAAPETGMIAEPPAGTARERWHLYSEGYWMRLVDAIRNDYPAVARVLGESPFDSLCRRYLRAVPPSSPDIGMAGDGLPGFLAGDPLLERLPFLHDLARFEWAIARAVVAGNPRPVSWEELASLGVEALLDLPIHLQPGAAVLRSEWPLSDIWAIQEIPDEAVSLEIAGRPSILAILRDGLDVRWREVDDDQARFLEALAEAPASLADLADSGRFGAPELAAPLLVSLFRAAIESSIVGGGSDVAQTRTSTRRD
jgi:hypothetical protein